jgi:hypothetical protein
MTSQTHSDSVDQPAESAGRKVVAGHFLSLDGVAESPDRFITAWDDETEASGVDLIATQDAVVLGRRTYDEWAGFWPDSDIQPFASFINAVPKYVATSTPLEREWSNARAIDGGLVDRVRQLKAEPGGYIGVHGVPPVRLETVRGSASPSGHLLVRYRVLHEAAHPAAAPGDARILDN